MKLHTLIYILLFGATLLVACQNQVSSEEENLMQQASLVVKIKTATTQASSRGIEDLNNDGITSELEEVIDGRRMYSLAVALVDNTNTLIEPQHLKQGDSRFSNDNKEATVTFERLDYGQTYQLLAVANYGNYDTNITGNLTSADNLTGKVNVTANETSKLCPKDIPYPLSLKKEIILQPGTNTISGELVRTYARLRINVRNQSKTKDLKINGLTFGNKFTQASADLFVSGGEATVSPDVTSDDAITPFVNPTTIAKVTDDGTVTEKTIFDAYLLESEGGDYTYKLNLEYAGVEQTVYTVDTFSEINDLDNIENGKPYVIYRTINNSKYYLYADDKIVSASKSYMMDEAVNPNYVWKFTKLGNDNNYFIESMGNSGYYMQSSGVTTGSVPLVETNGNDDYFTISENGNNNNKYLWLKSTKSEYYLNISSNYNSITVNGATKSNQNQGKNFRFYKVEKSTTTGHVTFNDPITIATLNKETGEATPITAIKRNDFINILVNVNYNEKSGKFLFEVTDWSPITGGVTFE